MVSIKDIAKEANISVTTVSRVLNKPSLVNVETKNKILKVIEKFDYTPSIIARLMRGQKTKTIGVIIPDFMNLYYSEWISHVEVEAKKSGYLAIIASTKNDPEREKEYINDLINRNIDGIIICWYQNPYKNLELLNDISKKIPVVLMDQPASGLPVSAVYADAYSGFRELTKHLVNLGHNDIAIIRGYKKYFVADCRFQAYIDVLKESMINIDEALIEECDFNAGSAYFATKRLLMRSKPTAIIGASDLVAIGILKFVTEKGFRVPEDIAIAGYDNILLSKLVTPKLTTVQEPIKQMAKTAIKILIEKINNKNNKKVKNKNIILGVKLLIRESTDFKRFNSS